MADLFVTQAGADGRYEIKLPASSYAPVARSETYLSSPATVDLSKDQTVDITVQRLNPKSAPAPGAVVAWIKQSAIALATTEPGTGLDDLARLKAAVGGARLVAMGESTHGTREFFQLKHRAADLAAKIAAKLDAERGAYVKKKAGERGFLLARIHARVLADSTLFARSGDGSVRDRSMAEIVAALLEVEDLGGSTKSAGAASSKMMLWAHNGHMNKHDNGGPPSMGSHLSKRFGAGYFALGFAFDEGSFHAIDAGSGERGLMRFTVPSAPPGSLDHTLGRAGIPLFALDLRGAPAGPVADWIAAASYSRSIGSVFDENVEDFALYPLAPTEHFDALFFVQKTTAAHANETTKRFQDLAKRETPVDVPDPGFEAAKKGEPPVTAWKIQTNPAQLEYRATVTDAKCASGKQCLVVERTKGTSANGSGVVSILIDGAKHRGRKLRVSASVRAESKGPNAKAYLFATTALDGYVWAPVPGSVWSKVEVNLDVPADAERILLGLAIAGSVAGFIDDIDVSSAPAK